MQHEFDDYEPAADLSLPDIIRILWHRKIALALVTAIGCAAGLWIAKTQPPLFTAEGVLLLRLQQTAPEVSTEQIPPEWDVATERDAITSRAMLSAALDKVDVPPELMIPERPSPIEWALRSLAPGAVDAPEADRIRAAQIDAVQNDLVVEANERSLALSVALTGPSAQFVADFVNALMETYLERGAERMAALQTAILVDLERSRISVQDRIAVQAEALETVLAQPDSDFAVQRARTRVEQLESISQALALESEQSYWTVGDVSMSIAAPAVPPLRPSRSKTVFILAAAGILSGGGAAVAAIVSAQRASRRPRE